MCGVYALAMWKLSQYPCEYCNSSCVMAVLAVLYVSAVRTVPRAESAYSRFQHSFVKYTVGALMFCSRLHTHRVCAL